MHSGAFQLVDVALDHEGVPEENTLASSGVFVTMEVDDVDGDQPIPEFVAADAPE